MSMYHIYVKREKWSYLTTMAEIQMRLSRESFFPFKKRTRLPLKQFISWTRKIQSLTVLIHTTNTEKNE